MIREKCSCGWPKPLFAIAGAEGRTLEVRILCPVCETPYLASERARSDVEEDARRIEATALACTCTPAYSKNGTYVGHYRSPSCPIHKPSSVDVSDDFNQGYDLDDEEG